MKRVLWFCAALLLLSALWCARKTHPHHTMTMKRDVQDHLAQWLVGSRFQESPRIQSFFAGYADLARYHAANQALPHNAPGRVVFYGDSITDFWASNYTAQFFPGKNYIGRGITGQSSRQMVWRVQQDVIGLRPAAVVILAGTNDIILPSRHVTRRQTIENIQAIVQASKRNGIRVIVCSLLPVLFHQASDQAAYTQQIRSLNAWLQSYAAAQEATYLDYFTPMSNSDGSLNRTLSNDGIHPNTAGYALMQSLAQQALTRR